jgi:hypothetical protein
VRDWGRRRGGLSRFYFYRCTVAIVRREDAPSINRHPMVRKYEGWDLESAVQPAGKRDRRRSQSPEMSWFVWSFNIAVAASVTNAHARMNNATANPE